MAAAQIYIPGWMPAFARNGDTCVARLYFYADGTTDPKPVYTSSALTTKHPFPIVSDDAGRFPAIWAATEVGGAPNMFTVSAVTDEADPYARTFNTIQPGTAVVEGAPGPSGSQEIGTVTSVAYGAGSTVTNVGTPEAAIWNIQLERGPQGQTGSGTGDMLASANLSDVSDPATALANIGGLPKAGGTMTGALTLAADAANPLEPATKQQMEAADVALSKRLRVRAATTANIAIATALNNGDVLDGVTLADGDLVLVKDQTSQAQNGVYVVGATPARSTEYDAWGDFPASFVGVAEGTANGDTAWFCTSNYGGTIGTTAITFARVRIDVQVPVPASQGGTGITAPGASGNVLTSNGAGGWTSSAPANSGIVWDFIAYDEKSSGTSGGASVSGTRVDRAFATVKRNTLSLAASSTLVTLTEGTWVLRADAPGCGCSGHRIYIYDASAGADLERGTSEYSLLDPVNAYIATSRSHAEATITVGVGQTKDIKIRHYTQVAVAQGLGVAVGAGDVEVYTRVFAKKVA